MWPGFLASGFGYASSPTLPDIEDLCRVTTGELLVAGSVNEFAPRVRTTGHWHCSISDEEGCSWYEGEGMTYA